MPTIHKKFRLETEPISTTVDQEGGKSTSFASLNFRVLDAATDMPIGLVLHVRYGDGMKYEAIPLYTNSGEPLVAPRGDWGKDVHGAARNLWRDWNKTLFNRTRFVRYVSRWLDFYWWAIGIATGVGVSVVLQSIAKVGTAAGAGG